MNFKKWILITFIWGSIASASDQLRISIHHGYLDGRPYNSYVYDLSEKNDFKNQITLPCGLSPYKYLCGFSFKFNNLGDYFYQKEITTNKGTTKISVSEYTSSYSSDDNENQRHKAEQDFSSQRAKSLFLKSFSQADIVIYFGHSRYGGGPDFFRPILTEDGRHDKDYYKSKKFTGFKDMSEALAQSAHHPAYIGLYSCDSKKHFGQDLRSDFPDIQFLTTPRPIKTNEAAQMIFTDLDPAVKSLIN